MTDQLSDYSIPVKAAEEEEDDDDEEEEEEEEEGLADPDFIPSSDSDEEEPAESIDPETVKKLEAEEALAQQSRGASLWQQLIAKTSSSSPSPSSASDSNGSAHTSQPRASQVLPVVENPSSSSFSSFSSSSKRVGPEPPSLTPPSHAPRPPAKKSRLAELVSQLGPKSKTSTIQKSVHEWGLFKKTAGVEDEMRFSLQAGYLDSQSFLQMSDQKQHESFLQGKKK